LPKKETKNYDLEIPLIITTKSGSQRTSQRQEEDQTYEPGHEYEPIDDPPTYA
ncbi:16909_t:CDS:1, partial [Acaulospora colombiana]